VFSVEHETPRYALRATMGKSKGFCLTGERTSVVPNTVDEFEYNVRAHRETPHRK
jgi:hypothetical protein